MFQIRDRVRLRVTDTVTRLGFRNSVRVRHSGAEKYINTGSHLFIFLIISLLIIKLILNRSVNLVYFHYYY